MDVVPVPGVGSVALVAKQLDIGFTFLQHGQWGAGADRYPGVCDSATVTLPEPVNLLFIDTWHVYPR